MTLKKRRIIFYGFVLIFIPLSAGVIFYSQGWRPNINIEDCKISKLQNCEIKFQKTGAVYIETIPKGVVIKLNNKQVPDQSGIIKSGTLIPNLLPKNYKIEIQKNGYLTYRKNLKVEQSMVAELIDTILIPEKFEKTTAMEKIKGDEIIDLNTKRIIIKNLQSKIFYLYKFNEPTTAFNINASFNNSFKKQETMENIRLHPFNEDRLFIKTFNGLYIFDTRKLQIETIFQNTKNDKILAWSNDNSNIYIAKSKNNSVYSYNLITKNESKIFNLPENSEAIIGIKTSGSEIAFLDKSNALLMFNVKEKIVKKIADNVKNFSFAPDNKKMFFLNTNGTINIYFIENWYKNSTKAKGEIANFNLRNKESIKNAYWHKDSYHLLVEYKNGIVDFMEIDDRPPLNQSPIASETDSNFYDTGQNLLYFIQNKTLYNVKI